MSVDTDKRLVSRSALNAANTITVARILLIPVFVVLLVAHVPYGDAPAAAVFAVAALTDKLDGYIARRATRSPRWASSSTRWPTSCSSPPRSSPSWASDVWPPGWRWSSSPARSP